MASTERRVVEGLLFVAVYIGLDALDRTLLAYWPVGVPWYPPAGIALAYVLVRGGASAPWVLLARLILLTGPGHRVPFALGAVNAVVSTGLTLSLGALFRQLPLPRGIGPAAWRFVDAARFYLLALVAGGAYGGLAALLDLLERVPVKGGHLAFAARYGIGDAVGIAIVVPTLLLFWPARSVALRGRGRLWGAIIALLALTGLALQGLETTTGLRVYYVALVPLGWAAISGGVAGAVLGVTALDVTLTVAWALMGGGQTPQSTQLEELQAFTFVAAAGALLLGAVSSALDAELASRRQAETRLRAVIDQSVAGFFTVVRERFAFVNNYFASLLGYTVDELLAMPSVFDIVADEDQGRVRSSFARRVVGEGDAEAHYVFAAVRKDGTRVVLEIHAIGTVLGGDPAVIGAAIDRTALATTEAALRERDEQLRQVQKMEAVGQLAGGVAHDFNNMLTAIGANVALALQEAEHADPADARWRVVRESLIEIRDAASRSADLTRQLLAFGRKQVLRPRAVQIDAVVRGSLPLLRRLLDADVRIETRLDAGDATVVVDSTQLEQVLLNLVVNARDAMRGASDKRLTIATRCETAAARARPGLEMGRYAVLSVQDVGHGMDESTQARIFEPFFTTKPLGEGTGLGLATVFGIVTQSGGHIFVDSEPGRGTTFSIYLRHATTDGDAVPDPLGASTHGATATIGATAAAPATPTARTSAGRHAVLVVEDEDVVRRVVRRTLTLAGYQVLEAGNPAEALRLWPSVARDVGLVVTDMVMPDLDGLQLAARLRETDATLPVLLVSGYSEALIDTHGPLPEYTGWLGKPFTSQELRDAVSSMMQPA